MTRERRSWNDATTRPARLRVVNNSLHSVHALWVTERGKEALYSSLAPGDVHMQSAARLLAHPPLHSNSVLSRLEAQQPGLRCQRLSACMVCAETISARQTGMYATREVAPVSPPPHAHV